MKRFLPSSLLGQVMLVLVIGLLAAQAFSAVLLYRAAEQRRETALVSSIAFRFIAASVRSGRTQERSASERQRRLDALRSEGFRPRDDRHMGRRPFPRGVRLGVERSEESPLQPGERRLESYEEALRDVFDQQSVIAGQIAVVRRKAMDDPYIKRVLAERPRASPPDIERRNILVATVQRADQGGWVTVRMPEPPRPPAVLATILLQTLVIFAVLVLLLFLVLRRITHPLSDLTDRVSDFSRQPDRAIEMRERGPSDVRRLIAAHNAMETRVASLLDEKDVMLGAIGHDLKTPLAALRVRIESVPDETQRERMADSIEDMTATLDDILTLARIGRSQAEYEAVDLGALAIGVVEEFEDLGQPVAIEKPPRVVAKVQVTWVKRALRNLISNAVRYGERADVFLLQQAGYAILRVDDKGAGIVPERIADMMEPFTRGEGSRNRSTGGAGLGLTLARAIAEQHRGELTLTNRDEGGLRAELRLPL